MPSGKAMHGHDPFPNMRKHGLGNRLIVVDEIAFGDSTLWEKYLFRTGNLYGMRAIAAQRFCLSL
jgi:hypothetical protein